jgi:hypothetical protein
VAGALLLSIGLSATFALVPAEASSSKCVDGRLIATSSQGHSFDVGPCRLGMRGYVPPKDEGVGPVLMGLGAAGLVSFAGCGFWLSRHRRSESL